MNNKKYSYFTPYMVYLNAIKMLDYRNLEIVYSSNYSEKERSNISLNQETFTKQFQFYGYIILEAKDSKNKIRRNKSNKPIKTFIIITKSYNVGDLTKQISKIDDINKIQRNFSSDIIIISEFEVTKLSLQKLQESIEQPETNDSGYINVNTYIYDYFTSERPKHKIVPEHRILTQKEEDSLLNITYLDKSNMPKISVSDVNCVWIGAEIDDVIEIKMISEASGYEYYYRVVKKI